MENAKPLSFSATAGSYFVLAIVSIVLAYIPIFGWAGLLGYAPGWFADRTLVNGKKVSYHTGYGENLKFVFLNLLLIIITLGIYSFWFYPKMYRYIADHVSYADTVPTVAAEPVETPVAPQTPDAPLAPAPSTPAAPAPTETVAQTPPADPADTTTPPANPIG